MIQKTVTLINKLGLHARASAKLVSVASRFSSKIEFKLNHQIVNCKSIMGVMMLGATKGTALELIVNGDDEQLASTAIEDLVQRRFDEKE